MPDKSIGSTERFFKQTRSRQESRPERFTEHPPAYLYALVGWRLTALGINPKSIERHSPDLLLLLRSRCALCADKGKCLEDMMDLHHPPGWEEYCPNAEVIAALVADPRFCLRKNIPVGGRFQSD